MTIITSSVSTPRLASGSAIQVLSLPCFRLKLCTGGSLIRKTLGQNSTNTDRYEAEEAGAASEPRVPKSSVNTDLLKRLPDTGLLGISVYSTAVVPNLFKVATP